MFECFQQSIIILILRGLCNNDVTDIFYTVMWNEKTNMPYYKGKLLDKLEGLTMLKNL